MDARTAANDPRNWMGARWIFAAVVAGLAGCGDGSTHTLYRDSVSEPNARFHVASFDASEAEQYNRGNCEIAQQLFQAQPGIKTKFWCEKGRYRK
jgi:hypothetical protein